MKSHDELFPFGSLIVDVEQGDRTPKKVFVLGVYASAVHATWYADDGDVRVRALAVRSEPEIFWTGENAEKLVAEIKVPEGCGYLKTAGKSFNGPSGKALDELYLEPLRVKRRDAWLCDLLPRSRMNPSQREAIKRAYNPLAESGKLPEIFFPEVPSKFADGHRRSQIVEQMKQSEAKLLILLGDVPIKEFLSYYLACNNLSQVTKDGKTYGDVIHDLNVEDLTVDVLPLVHPRQAARLGAFDSKWAALHDEWVDKCKKGILQYKF